MNLAAPSRALETGLQPGQQVRLLLIIFSEAAEDEVRRLLDAAGAPGWTEVRRLIGRGESGLRLGNTIWPGNNAALFCAVPCELADRIASALREYLERHLTPHGAAFVLRVFSLSAEVLV
ncbi:MAG: hypothetical protein K6U89_00410 [Chloroflexi bacterium]|nr:hypothetical protein [Chloroflexota bacterium]